MLELVEMREVIEGLAARRAARQISQQALEQMRACFSSFHESNLVARRLKYATADHRFHLLLMKASNSAELIRTLEVINIRLHMNRLRRTFSQGPDRDLFRIHREHLAIIATLEDGNASAAEQLVRAHVRNVPWDSILQNTSITYGAASRRTGSVA